MYKRLLLLRLKWIAPGISFALRSAAIALAEYLPVMLREPVPLARTGRDGSPVCTSQPKNTAVLLQAALLRSDRV
jgi:hypothetical protein